MTRLVQPIQTVGLLKFRDTQFSVCIKIIGYINYLPTDGINRLTFPSPLSSYVLKIET